MGIYRVPKTGGAITSVVTTALVATPYNSLLLDSLNVYFWNPEGVFSCPKSGCVSPTKLSADDVSELKVFGSDLFYIRSDGILARCSINGCLSAGSTVIANIGADRSLVIDSITTAYVAGASAGLRQINLTTGVLTTLIPNVTSVTADAINLYYDLQQNIYRCAKTDCAATATKLFATTLPGAPLPIDGRLYFSSFDGTYINSCASTSCTPTTLVVAPQARLVGVDANFIYFARGVSLYDIYRAPL